MQTDTARSPTNPIKTETSSFSAINWFGASLRFDSHAVITLINPIQLRQFKLVLFILKQIQ